MSRVHKPLEWRETWYMGIRDAVLTVGCTWPEMEDYIARGVVRLSNMPHHRHRRVVHTEDIIKIVDDMEHQRYGVPIVNLPPRTGTPNCLLYTPAIRPPKSLPVPMPPTKAYFVYVLRLPNGNPFYVGKGTRARPYEHINEAMRGECSCRKCQVIQLIHKMHKEVLITYEFDADDTKSALAEEKRLIQLWCREYHLTNRSGNPYYDRSLPLPKPMRVMTRQELSLYLDRMPLLTKQERKRRIAEWCEDRIDHLEGRWRVCRQQHEEEEAAKINAEIDVLRIEVGAVFQRELPLDTHYSKRDKGRRI